MDWAKAFANDERVVTIKLGDELVRCQVLEESWALTNDFETWPSGMKPSGRYWLKRLDTGQRLFPRSLPR